MTVVGVFEGVATLPNGSDLTAADGFDGFIVRLSPDGAVLSARAIDFAAVDAIVQVVELGERIGFLLASDDGDGLDVTFRVGVTRAASSTIDYTEVPGVPTGFDVLPSGVVVAAAVFEADVSITMQGGGTTTLQTSQGFSSYLAAFDDGVGQWVRGAKGVPFSAQSMNLQFLVAGTDRIVWTLPFEAGGALMSESYVDAGRQVVELDALGALVDHRAAPAEWSLVWGMNRFERERYWVDAVHALVPLDDVETPDDIEFYQDRRSFDFTQACAFTFQPSVMPDLIAGVGGALPANEQFFLVATEGAQWDFGSGVILAEGNHKLAFVVSDDTCRPRAVFGLGVQPLDEGPSSMRGFLRSYFLAHARGSRAGRVVLTAPMQGTFPAGAVFGNPVLTIEGDYDAVVGSIGPASLYGCETTP